jgi:hypothetical protein
MLKKRDLKMTDKISLMSAVIAGDWVSSHDVLGRHR